MELLIKDPEYEINRLQRCVNDLVSLLALPAVWSGREPSQIVRILVDALLKMLRLDFIYVRLNDPVTQAATDILRTADSYQLTAPREEMCEIVSEWIQGNSLRTTSALRTRIGNQNISLFPIPLGLQGEFGIMAVASERSDFPGQTESLLLTVAANQASVGLSEATLRGEQKRIADELEQRVAQRTTGLAQANEALRKEIVARKKVEDRLLQSEAAVQSAFDEIKKSEAKLRRVIDTIPTLAWCNLADGPNEFLSKQWHEYTGLSPEESHGWGWQAAFHPKDLPALLEKWRKMLVSGESDEIEARLRRHDGVYRWFLIRAQAFRDDSGNIVRWYGTSTDIEDRKRVEEALRATERNLAAIINTIPTTAWSTGPDGYCDFLNHVWLDYAGMTTEQARGWGWVEAIHPNDRKRLVGEWQSSLASGTPVDTEARIRRFDASYRWFLIRGNPLKDESGNILKWYGTCVDIEDRKCAEQKLRQSEQDLRTITDAIRQSIVVLAPDGSTLYANRVALDRTGLTLGEANDHGFFTRVFHPEEADRLLAERQQGLFHGLPFELESRVRQRNGEYRWQLLQYNPLKDESDKIIRWYVTATDIDDRKRAEARVEQAYLRLAEAQRLSKTGSFITDLVADDHDWSEEAFRIFEFDPSTKVTVQMIRDIVHPEDLPTFDAVIARGMTGIDVDFVFRIVPPRGAMKHIRGMARVMTQIGAHPLFIGALQDVTESKASEAALDKARSELAHVARVSTLNALTASMAHEINQPLSGIITNAGTCLRMLNGDPPNIEGARETARRTLRDGNRASDVVTRLRALFSKKEFVLEPLDLNEATGEVIALSLSDLQRNRVVVRSELSQDLPQAVGDRIQLQQVTLNLLRNASEAMASIEDRPRELVIRTRRGEDDNVCLSVQDAGVGVNPQDLERLFEAFYTTKSGGMGIGLFVCRSIIEKHHGRLWADLNNGPGLTFSFCIPCAPESSLGVAHS